MCCAAVLATRVYVDFDRIRIGVTRAEHAARGGVVAVSIPDLSSLAGQPAALVTRLRNDSDTARVIRVVLAETEIASTRLEPQAATRLDLQLATNRLPAARDRLEFASDDDGWSVQGVEIANVHGFSAGLFSFVVVPSSASPGHAPPLWLVALLLPMLVAVPPRWRRLEAGPRARRVHASLGGMVTAVFVVVLVAPLVSPYCVLIAVHTYIMGVIVLYLPAVERLARFVVKGPSVDAPISTSDLRRVFPSVVCGATAVVFLASIAQLRDPEHGYTTLIRFGSQFEDQTLPRVRAVPRSVMEDSAGYDGQFYAQIAVDPLLRDPALPDALDDVQYRGRRILFAWTAYLLGQGQPTRVLTAYAVQNIVFWILLGVMLFRWLPPVSVRNSVIWSTCMLSHGLVISVWAALPDGPSMLFHMAALMAVAANHRLLAAALIGVSGLGKDINLLAAPVLAPSGGWRQLRPLTGLTFAMLLSGPLVAWVGYLWVSGHDLTQATGVDNFAQPLVGYFGKWGETIIDLVRDGWESPAWLSVLTLVSLGTQALVLLLRSDERDPWWRLGIGYVLLMTVLGPNVWTGHPGASTRVLLPMTFAFNMVLPRDRWFWPLFVLGNLTTLVGVQLIRAGDIVGRLWGQ